MLQVRILYHQRPDERKLIRLDAKAFSVPEGGGHPCDLPWGDISRLIGTGERSSDRSSVQCFWMCSRPRQHEPQPCSARIPLGQPREASRRLLASDMRHHPPYDCQATLRCSPMAATAQAALRCDSWDRRIVLPPDGVFPQWVRIPILTAWWFVRIGILTRCGNTPSGGRTIRQSHESQRSAA